MNLNNLSDVYKQLQGLSSVKDVGKKALLELEKKDPATARMLCSMIYGKQSPAQALKQFAQSGRINIKQIDKIHTAYNMLKKLGLKLNVPDSMWLEAEQVISGNKDLITPPTKKGF
jgi:hypothetical protein